MASSTALAAFYAFDETSGFVAHDHLGAHDGTIIGATHVPGVTGNALQFNGSSDYVSVPDSPEWNLSGDFTLEFWADFNSVPGGGAGGDVSIGQDEGGGTTNKWFLNFSDGNINFHVVNPSVGQNFTISAPFVPATGQPYAVALTKAGSAYTFYVDGQPVGSAVQTLAIPDVAAPLTIGQAEDAFYFDGKLDGVAIYHRALSPAELLQDFQDGAGAPGQPTTTTGTNGADTLTGTDGADTILGLAGNDILQGLAGNDRLDGGTGRDRMVGGAGDDTYVVDNFGDVVVENSGGGTDTVLASVSYALAGNVENLTLGGSGHTSGAGNGLANTLIGNGGNNVLLGLAGSDTINAGAGNDWLAGGLGADFLTGGPGADRFVFVAAAESTPAAFDTVQDFLGADRIDLAAIDANAARNGNQAFAFAGQNSGVVANSVTWFENGGNTFVQADVNGNTTADLTLVLTGINLNLTASVFVL